MMQCPACSAPIVSGEPRCVGCQALVNPPTNGNAALAPRLVTPQNIERLGTSPFQGAGTGSAEVLEPAASGAATSEDEAWRREVLERVRKRRQLRAHALPLFVDSPGSTAGGLSSHPSPVPSPSSGAAPTDPPAEELEPLFPDTAIDRGHLVDAMMTAPSDDMAFDLPLRPAESRDQLEAPSLRDLQGRGQSLVVRPRFASVGGPTGPRSLVGDLPLVEPTQTEPAVTEPPTRASARSRSFGAATIGDRVQAGFIDLGLWSAMSVTAFYFASRIARTPLAEMGPGWKGLTLFAMVLAAAYILFFGGLSGASPGKMVCGIHVRRYDGSALGPLAALRRGVLGILGVVLLGAGVWPAFWDKDRRTLHDRATDSRVTTA